MADVPEPDNVYYGQVYIGTNQITAANTEVVIEARRTPAGAALASYRMGANPAFANNYSLRVNLESVAPIGNSQAFQSGDSLYLTLTDATGVRDQKAANIGARGQLTRVDFGYPNYPPDWIAHLLHPADISPADNAVSISEMVTYALAWKLGQPWPLAPNPIPVAYVTRAGALWRGGESYVFDPAQVSPAFSNSPLYWVTNAPLWWANTAIAAPVGHLAGGWMADTPGLPPKQDDLSLNRIVRSMRWGYVPGVPLVVTNLATCAADVGVYAVEDQPPVGWQVTQISDGGVFDANNNRVKWGLFFDNSTRVLTYTLTPTAQARGPATFSGQGGFDGYLVLTVGQTTTVFPSSPVASYLRLPNGAFSLALRGYPGGSGSVDVSTNLTNWSPWTNITFDLTGLWQVTDWTATNFPLRFYRARSEGP